MAEAWKRGGHTAIFAVGEERSEMVRGAGFDARSLPEVPGGVFRKDRGWRWVTPSYFDQNIHAEQAIIAGERPDVVVFDFRFTTAVSARLANLPSVSILHGNAIRLIRQPRQTARLMIGDPREAQGVAALKIAILRRLFPFFFTTIMRRIAHRFTPRLKAYGMAQADSIFQLLAGDEILVADIAEFLPPDLPSNHHVVGPLMWSGWEQPAPWLTESKTQPLIYVTMGSTVEVQAELVKIIDGLRDAPYDVIIGTASLSLPPDLQIPAHIRLFSIVPGATIMRSSRVAIHHGGHETLMQALAAGVPSLMLPMNPDQALVAQQAQALGVGRSLGMPGYLPIGASMLRKLTPTQVRQEVDRLVVDAECQRICEKLKDKIKAGNGASLAAEVLERVVTPRERLHGAPWQ